MKNFHLIDYKKYKNYHHNFFSVFNIINKLIKYQIFLHIL